MSYIYEYPRPAVTADCVIFGFDESELNILLIERGIEPFKNCWALPGGFINMDEDAETCARRKLKQETCLENIFMEQLFTFTAVCRDPRYRVISIAYYALVKLADYEAKAGMDTARVKWFPLTKRPLLAFDHQKILNVAIERLKGKIRYCPIGFELLPERFTLPDLHRLYETVLQTKLDRRNFRKKILTTGLLIDRQEQKGNVPHKAPKIYSFDKRKYEELCKKGFYFEV